MQNIEELISNYKEIFGLADISSLTILSITIIILILFVFKKINNFYLISFLTLPGTFMHELMHLLTSFISFGKPVKFTIIPKRNGNGITLGSVSSANITWYNAIFISLSPLFLYIFCCQFIICRYAIIH